MECHKCEHQADVAAGKFHDVVFEETPCSQCQLKETSLYTIEFDERCAEKRGAVCENVPFPEEVEVELEGAEQVEPGAADAAPVEVEALVMPVPELADAEAPATEVAIAPVTVLADALAGLLVLPPRTLESIKWRLRGMRYSEIAAAEGVTTAAVEKRLARAVQAWPALQGLFCVKSAKQARRKAHRRGAAGAVGQAGG